MKPPNNKMAGVQRPNFLVACPPGPGFGKKESTKRRTSSGTLVAGGGGASKTVFQGKKKRKKKKKFQDADFYFRRRPAWRSAPFPGSPLSRPFWFGWIAGQEPGQRPSKFPSKHPRRTAEKKGPPAPWFPLLAPATAKIPSAWGPNGFPLWAALPYEQKKKKSVPNSAPKPPFRQNYFEKGPRFPVIPFENQKHFLLRPNWDYVENTELFFRQGFPFEISFFEKKFFWKFWGAAAVFRFGPPPAPFFFIFFFCFWFFCFLFFWVLLVFLAFTRPPPRDNGFKRSPFPNKKKTSSPGPPWTKKTPSPHGQSLP